MPLVPCSLGALHEVLALILVTLSLSVLERWLNTILLNGQQRSKRKPYASRPLPNVIALMGWW
jgi:hypothetical protein